MTHSKKRFPAICIILVAFCGCLLKANPAAQTKTFQPLDLSEKPTLFQIGYSHLDTVWRWGYPQVIREFLPDTVRQNAELFRKYPNYVLNFTGAGRYKLIQEYHPEDFEKIRAAVAAGNWWPNGSSWEETDVNVPSAESLVRQLLFGHEYFMREFGTESSEFMLPDCFGFPASLPSILAHCGLRGFSTQKLSWGSAVGVPFNVGEWIGPDGNSVIAALNGGGYVAPVKEDPSFNRTWLKRITGNGEKSGVYADFIYMGAGDRGGAPKESSVALLEQGVLSNGSVRVISARADAMFLSITDAQKARLPKFTGDMLLTEHSAGSITSQAYMKHWNRRNELLADAAERASVAAWLLGAAPYPREKLNRAWELMLRTQMHDMLPGTSLPKVYEYGWNDEVIVMNSFAEALVGAVGAVASGLDTRGGGIPLVIYNPLSVEREDVVEAAVTLPVAENGVQVFDDTGRPVPTQLLSHDGEKASILFLAKAPSVGFVVYSVKTGSAAVADAGSTLKAASRTLENARYRVTLNDAGDITSILDKLASRELLSAPTRLAFLNESPGKYPAWNMDWADRQKPPRGYVDGKARIEIVENGPVRVALRVRREAQGSSFDQIIRLAVGDAGNRIEISNTIDWLSKGCSLKAEFPLAVSNPLATYNWDLGKVERGNNDEKKYEVPSHQWFDLTHKDGSHGVSILTGAKYGSDKLSDNTVRLTLLYTPDVSKMKNYQEQRWQDWGRHDFVYGIYSHAGDWRKGGTDWQALRMEQPLLAFTTAAHDGKLGRSFSLLKVDSAAVAVRAIKLAQSGDRVIVRLQELNGAPQTGVTLSTTATPIAGAAEVTGLEKHAGDPGGTASDSALSLDFKRYQMRSLAFTLGGPRSKLDAPVSVPVDLPYNLNGFGYRGSSANGNFDGEDGALPGEMMGDTVISEGIVFKIGPHLKAQRLPNVVRCEGQVVPLPEGKYNRIYLLAAAVRGDASGEFKAGGIATTLNIQNWNGYVGSWDNRVFNGKVEELTYSVNNNLDHIATGFIKRDPLAWYCDRYYQHGGRDAIYSYSYLYKYALDVPDGARTFTLPKNLRIRIVAVTAALDPAAATQPAQPLYDDFTNRKPIRLPAGWANKK